MGIFVRFDATTLISSGVTGLASTMIACWSLIPLKPLEPGFLTYGEPSAYLPDRSLAIFPPNNYAWTNASADEFMAEAMRLSAKSLFEAGIQDGQDLKNARLTSTTRYSEHH